MSSRLNSTDFSDDDIFNVAMRMSAGGNDTLTNEPSVSVQGCKDKDPKDILEQLNRQFNYAPRDFTESLVTIIEETFSASDEIANDFLEFLKKSEAAKLLEHESIPHIDVTPSSDIADDSTEYLKIRQTPGKKRESEKLSAMTYRVRVDSASDKKSPRKGDRTFSKTPKILIRPATPQAYGSRRMEYEVANNDDDDYLTAESDTEESGQTSIEPEESAEASSSLNMSRFGALHKKWSQAYKQVAEPTSTTGNSMRKLVNHGDKLEKRRLRDLQEKRRKCFEFIEQLIIKHRSAVSSNQIESNCCCTSGCQPNTVFYNTLRAISEYFDSCKNSREVSTLKKNRDPSPRSSHQRTTSKTPRKSLTRGHLKLTPSAAKSIRPSAKLGHKRRSLKSVKSPVIDRTSLRPVSELRLMFSPGVRAAEDRVKKSKPKTMGVKRAASRKFQHVVSPVARYIKGDN